jgi:hypothetical protein
VEGEELTRDEGCEAINVSWLFEWRLLEYHALLCHHEAKPLRDRKSPATGEVEQCCSKGSTQKTPTYAVGVTPRQSTP